MESIRVNTYKKNHLFVVFGGGIFFKRVEQIINVQSSLIGYRLTNAFPEKKGNLKKDKHGSSTLNRNLGLSNKNPKYLERISDALEKLSRSSFTSYICPVSQDKYKLLTDVSLRKRNITLDKTYKNGFLFYEAVGNTFLA